MSPPGGRSACPSCTAVRKRCWPLSNRHACCSLFPYWGAIPECSLPTRPPLKSTSYILKVSHFKFAGRHISQTGMQPLRVIHVVDELTNIGGCLFKRLVLLEIHLLLL